MNSAFSKLFDKNKPGGSQGMAIFGLIVGTLILLLGVQWAMDLKNIRSDTGPGTFVTINKPVNIFNSIGAVSDFKPDEIEKIAKMDGVVQASPYLSNQFKLRASVPRLGFYSELFFESLPKDFDLNLPEGFDWKPNDSFIPIVLPKDYIALYNFGFAPSQGLPQISAGVIERFSFDLEIRGSNLNGTHKGKIIGLSEEINTVLVPESFLRWANNRYFRGPAQNARRVGVKIEPGKATMLKAKLLDEGYELAGKTLLNDQTANLLNIAFLVVMLIGLLIFILAVYVAIQFRKLYFNKQAEHIRRLFEFGQSKEPLFQFLNKRFQKLMILGIGIGILLFVVLNYFTKIWMISKGFELNPFPSLFTIALGLLLLVFISWQLRKAILNFLVSSYKI